MSLPHPYCLLTLAAFTVTISACHTHSTDPVPPQAARALFTDHVRPILQENCLRCHSGSSAGMLDLSNRAAAFLPLADGRAYIMPGQPDKSLLVEAVSRNGIHQRAMPRHPISLTEDDIGTLREWIEAGAPWPTGAAGELSAAASTDNP